MTEQAKVPAIRFAGFTDPWEQRKLGDVASSFDYGLNAAATEYDGQNKYLRITDIDDETHEFSKSDLTTPLADLAMSADYLLKESDLLFARTGASVGKTYLYRQFDGMVYFAGFLIRARIGEGADPEFAYQATLTDAYKKYVAITSQRSGQPGVNAQEYADYQLMLPSKTEQQQIGMTLRSLDNLITLHQRKYDKLVVFKKSMLEKMFPKDGESVPEIRFAGFTDPWEQRKLGELVVIERGGSPRPIDEYITDDTNGLNWVKIGDAPSLGRYISKTSEKIKPEGLSKTRQVHPGDLILSNSMSFGRPYIMAIEGCIHDGWLLIRDEPKSFDPMYLCHMLGTPKMLNQYRMLASGSTVNNLNKELVSNASILMPCKSEQKVIGQFFNHLDDLITLHQRKLELLRNIKKSLLDKMFV